MNELDTPDLCARLDTMKKLCDQLEDAQKDPLKVCCAGRADPR
jgi:hypothetical protein